MNITRYIQQFRINNEKELLTQDGMERLRLLADFLEKLPPERFDLWNWSYGDFKPNRCGTTACACGWATTIFNEFELVDSFVAYKDFISWYAVEKFFQLEQREAMKLFSEGSYVSKATPKMVSEKIRKHLLDKPALAG